MENYVSFNATSSGTSITAFQLPVSAVAFAPFLLLELVATIVSNAILLKKLNNNINIYLFSFTIGGLIGAFDIFCLITLVVARNWVLGTVLCHITFFDMIIYNAIFVFIYLLISRDKLKGVKDPLYGRPTKKQAYISSAVVLVWVAVSEGPTSWATS